MWSPLPPTCLLVSPQSQQGFTHLSVLSQFSAQKQTLHWSAGEGKQQEQIVFLFGSGQEKGWANSHVNHIVHKTKYRLLKLRHFISQSQVKLQILL